LDNNRLGPVALHRVEESLVDRLRAGGYTLLDTQWATGHLEQFGAIELPRRRYLRLLDQATKIEAVFNG
jgi:leucyl/phenylalanyl-tRNA--protein transferase